MHLAKLILSNFRCFNEQQTEVALDQKLTCFVGNNGSGKTALLTALKRLFGATRDDRTIIRDDFYLGLDENYESIGKRKLFIEAIFLFPELKGKNIEEARKACPAFASIIYADENNSELKARMRLESIWDKIEYEDDVQSKIYWITTSQEIEFGENSDFKSSIPSQNRKLFKLRYIPAFRDSKTALRNEVNRLTKILEDYTDIEGGDKEKIETISQKLSDEFQEIDSIKTVSSLLEEIWQKMHDNTLKHYQKPKLEAIPVEIGKLLRTMSIKLAPSEDGDSKNISELSDGQVSLLYFTLAIAVYDIEQRHSEREIKGFKELDINIPIFTIFAFEEPENHLSPYYLGRVLEVLKTTTEGVKTTGIITSHSPSVVRRIDKIEQIRHFRQKIDSCHRHSIVKEISLPRKRTDEDYKYINQAVLAHPELYFSKLVILGEGASEEIVIPQLAKALGHDLDPSFVAFVKLGGRHVNHMWRLLKNLDLPFLTLLDLDLGRVNAGPKRIKDAIKKLEEIGINFELPEGITRESLEQGQLDLKNIYCLVKQLEATPYNVYFSSPLDFDMAMIGAFPENYEANNATESDLEILNNSVLGKGHEIHKYTENENSFYTAENLKKYRYLFCTKSKIASHYQAMANILERTDVDEKCPRFIKRLIMRCSDIIKGTEKNE